MDGCELAWGYQAALLLEHVVISWSPLFVQTDQLPVRLNTCECGLDVANTQTL